MNPDFINVTTENLDSEHLCCIIRSKKPHPGVEAKRRWLADRLKEGHVFRKLNEKALVFIEYAPMVKQYCETNGVPFSFMLVDTLRKAKELPCVFNNWAVFYKGKFETVNLLDAAYLKRILKK